MPGRYAELVMYVAPQPVKVASEQWLTRIVELLDVPRRDGRGLELLELFRSPDLLLTQTCGYPLMTLLRGQVQLVGRPRYELNDSSAGNHCSLIVSRATDPRTDLADFKGSRGVINDLHSNSGMNLFRHRLAPLQQGGRFFASVAISGAHQQSLRHVREGWADLACIDSVTFDCLARYAPAEVAGLRTVARTENSPTLHHRARHRARWCRADSPGNESGFAAIAAGQGCIGCAGGIAGQRSGLSTCTRSSASRHRMWICSTGLDVFLVK